VFDHIQAYYQPTSIPEALRLLRQHGPGGRFVSGATDLVVQAQRSTRFLIDVTGLGLSYVRHQRGGWALGSTTTMAELENSPKIRGLANGILAEAIATCGSVQLRNTATLGGNLANASPAADTATPLLALNASVVMQSARGKKTLPLEKFFAGPHRTVLNGSLLLEIAFPEPPARSGWSFQKLGRSETDISLVSVAAGLAFDAAGRCLAAQIALGAVAPTPLRAHAAEKLLAGQKLTGALIERAGETAKRDTRPLSDVRASAEYRTEMTAVLVRRALAECAARAGYSL
jgi:aerobic carbon-monoxide dehydrogenase medium subunit